MFLRIIKHLLPRARAWSITIDKTLRRFFDGLAQGLGVPIKLFFDLIYHDTQPQTTREIDAWEKQFGLNSGAVLTEQERRDRLDATWKAHGGQSPRYIQDTLQAAGFNVFLHEWWVPGSEPPLNVIAPAIARDPHDYLTGGADLIRDVAIDNGVDMQDGDVIAMDGAGTQPPGYPLVNKLLVFAPSTISDGHLDMQDGDILASDGSTGNLQVVYSLKNYVIPTDPLTYPYFLYIGGDTFPNQAIVPSGRKNEFETLCLKICPAHLWLGILVSYS